MPLSTAVAFKTSTPLASGIRDVGKRFCLGALSYEVGDEYRNANREDTDFSDSQLP
jgi:hypothetical protein